MVFDSFINMVFNKHQQPPTLSEAEMFTFTILFQDAEVSCAEAERFEDAREQAIEEASEGFYASVLRDCTFSATATRGVISRVTGPLFL